MFTITAINKQKLQQALAKAKVIMPENGESVSGYYLESDIEIDNEDFMLIAKMDRDVNYSTCKGDYLTPTMTDIDSQETEVYDIEVINEEGDPMPLDAEHYTIIQKFIASK